MSKRKFINLKKFLFKTLNEITKTIQTRENSNFDFYSNSEKICIIHIKFNDIRKKYINLNILKDNFFINEYDKYFSYNNSYFKNAIDILNYIKKYNLPIILYDSYLDKEISIDMAYLLLK